MVTIGSMTANIASYLLHLPASRVLGVDGYGVFASLLAAQLVLAVPALLSGMALTGRRGVNIAVLMAVIALALWPHPVSGLIALIVFLVMRNMGRTLEKGTA